MNFYGYLGNHRLGEEPLGTFDRFIFRDLKTTHGAVDRARDIAKGRSFRLYTFTNFYDDSTFRLVHQD